MTAHGRAHAYSDPTFFYRPLFEGGSAGRWFSGSPADGYGCDACHTSRPTLNPKLLPPQAPPRTEPLPAGPLVVTGLPKDGYVPGKTYEIRMNWPDYANRSRAEYQAGQPLGFMGVVAEFVSETGKDSGSFEVMGYERLAASEACVFPAFSLSTQLYRQPVTPYIDDEGYPVIADRPSASVCTATDGVRCIIAVHSCGAEQARVLWTAPQDFQGTIWFAAGYVATDHRTSDPSEDPVTLVSIPLAPAAAGEYSSRLEASSCSAALTRHSQTGAAWLLGLLITALIWRRRRSENPRNA
jgi:hypothetical protein